MLTWLDGVFVAAVLAVTAALIILLWRWRPRTPRRPGVGGREGVTRHLVQGQERDAERNTRGRG